MGLREEDSGVTFTDNGTSKGSEVSKDADNDVGVEEFEENQ